MRSFRPKSDDTVGLKEGESTMSSHTFRQQDAPSSDEIEVRTLYRQMLDGWNKRSAEAVAAPFALDGNLVGFDGRRLSGRTEITSTYLCRSSHSRLREQSQKRASVES